jgi:beta-glucosidase
MAGEVSIINLSSFLASSDDALLTDKPSRRMGWAEDETLNVRMGCDDGYRLIIDGDTVANVWKGRARVQMLNKPISVKAGKPVKIQVDYFQKTDMAVMQFDIVKNYTPTESQLLAEVGDADVVVFVGGISPSLEGEEMKVSEPGFKGGDRTDIELPQAQRKVMEMLHRAGKRVVFVNCSGSAIAMVPETENAESILQAWYPGERGGEAVAKVLFGSSLSRKVRILIRKQLLGAG